MFGLSNSFGSILSTSNSLKLLNAMLVICALLPLGIGRTESRKADACHPARRGLWASEKGKARKPMPVALSAGVTGIEKKEEMKKLKVQLQQVV